jgi:hypothetical protein
LAAASLIALLAACGRGGPGNAPVQPATPLTAISPTVPAVSTDAPWKLLFGNSNELTYNLTCGVDSALLTFAASGNTMTAKVTSGSSTLYSASLNADNPNDYNFSYTVSENGSVEIFGFDAINSQVFEIKPWKIDGFNPNNTSPVITWNQFDTCNFVGTPPAPAAFQTQIEARIANAMHGGTIQNSTCTEIASPPIGFRLDVTTAGAVSIDNQALPANWWNTGPTTYTFFEEFGYLNTGAKMSLYRNSAIYVFTINRDASTATNVQHECLGLN